MSWKLRNIWSSTGRLVGVEDEDIEDRWRVQEDVVAVSVSSGRRAGGDDGWLSIRAVLFEGGEVLRLLVFGDVEGRGGKAEDGVAVAVADDQIGEDEAGSCLQSVGGGWRSGRGWSLGDEGGWEKQKGQSESGGNGARNLQGCSKDSREEDRRQCSCTGAAGGKTRDFRGVQMGLGSRGRRGRREGAFESLRRGAPVWSALCV